jgi:uncharacterized protein with HEPN domain
MSASRTYLDFVRDMVDAIEKIEEFTAEMDYHDFAMHDKTAYAVIHALEIIGEATKQLPDPVRERYPQIPWRSIASMRDKLIHSYFNVNRAIVWQTVREDLPVLLPVLREILVADG